MKKLKFPIYKTTFLGNEKKYVNNCFDNNWISSSGPYVNKFENKFSEIFNSKYCLSTSNGTCALQLALMSLNLNKGDEVLIPNLTFAATINAVINANLRPVLCDVGKKDYNIDLSSIKKNFSKKSKVILLVHLYGKSCNLDDILKFSKDNDLHIVEDTAEAMGSKWNNKLLGTFGASASFSFFGNKTFTTGEGGMVIFKNKKNFEIAKRIRDHGMSTKKKYWHTIIGYNFRMTDLQAAVGLAQLENFKNIINKKIKIANIYKNELKQIQENILFVEDDRREINSYWLVNFVLKKVNKSFFIKDLEKKGIEIRSFFYSLDKMPPYKNFKKNLIKNSYYFENNGLCLPSYLSLTNKDIKFISSEIIKTIKKFNEKAL